MKSLSKIPILADVPILGNLFKSKSFQRNETELVFIVTAKITQPLNPDSLPQMKGVDGLKSGSPLGVEMPGTASGGGSSAVPATNENVHGGDAPATKDEGKDSVPFRNFTKDGEAKNKVRAAKDLKVNDSAKPSSAKVKFENMEWKIFLPKNAELTAQQIR